MYNRIFANRAVLFGTAGVALAMAPLARAQAPNASPASPVAEAQHNNTEAGAPAGDAAKPSSAVTLQEVVVTAQKRTENVQRTPIAVTAVGEAALDRAGVDDFQSLSKVAPDVQVHRTTSGEEIQIRGVVATDTSPTSQQPNAVFLDGGFLTKASALQGQFYDVSRVEILKGPQGTLYGRNATGGAINIITNKPTQDYSAEAQVEVGDYNLVRAEGAVNVPITDTLAARAAFQSYSHTGYQSSGLDDADEKGGRLELLWKPTNRQSLFLSADFENIGGVYPGQVQIVGIYPDRTGNTSLYGATGPIPSPQNDSSVFGDAHAHFSTDEHQYGLNAQYDYRFDWATATVQVNHRQLIARDYIPPTTGPAMGESYSTGYFDDTTVETRLTSATSKPLQWVVGGFFLNELDNGGPGPGQVTYANENNITDSGMGLAFGSPHLRSTSYAAFGQTTYTPGFFDSLHVILGARYTFDRQSGDAYTLDGPQQATTGCTAGAVPLNGACYLPGGQPFHALLDTQAFNYKAGLQYDLTSQSMIYGDVSTGYKAGGVAYGATPVYRPEHIVAYEVGSKNRFLDNRLQVNLEAFLYHYGDYEETLAFVIPTGGRYLSVVNAGRAVYNGEAADIQYVITTHDHIAVDATWTGARYGANNLSQFVPSLYASSVTVSNLTNAAITGVPRTSGTASYDHTWDMLGGSFDAQFALQYRGYTPLANYAVNTPNEFHFGETGWATYDMSLRYDHKGERQWSVTGYVRNLTDGEHVNFAQPYTNSTAGNIYGSYLPPRTFGFIVSAKYQ